MPITILSESGFEIIAEEVQKVECNHEVNKSKNYEFVKNENEEIVLGDESQEIVLNTIFDIDSFSDDEIFLDRF